MNIIVCEICESKVSNTKEEIPRVAKNGSPEAKFADDMLQTYELSGKHLCVNCRNLLANYISSTYNQLKQK